MSMYAVKNDEGKWLQTDTFGTCYWKDEIYDAERYIEVLYAHHDAKRSGGHVVELVEAPAKVVVSEEEAEMLATLRDGDLMPVCELSYFVRHAEQLPEKESIEREDRLIRAYVNGWTVEKPKRWNVKVPKKWSGDDKHYWTKGNDGALTWAYLINNDYMIPAQQFTAAEIEQYGLGECERVEVTDDEQ